LPALPREARLDTGDRTVYVAEVLDGALPRPGTPLTLKRMLELAPAEQKTALRKGLEEDAARDAFAIQEWRQQP
jgi:hypothetical protein